MRQSRRDWRIRNREYLAEYDRQYRQGHPSWPRALLALTVGLILASALSQLLQ